MKVNQLTSIICSLIIGISIIIDCMLIPTKNINDLVKEASQEISTVSDSPLLNIDQAAKYH